MIALATRTTNPPAIATEVDDDHFLDALSFEWRTAPDIARQMLAAGHPATLATIRTRMADFVVMGGVEARGEAWRIEPPLPPANDNPEALALNSIHHGDCLHLMRDIEDASIDLIICDLPYGCTKLRWDARIDLNAFWSEVRRILSPRGNVLMFATQPFSTDLIMSNREWFRYEMIWRKSRPTTFQHSKTRPLNSHESILMFSQNKHGSLSKSPIVYHPQGLIELETPIVRKSRTGYLGGNILEGSVQTHTNYPRSVLEFDSVSPAKRIHSTEKPVALIEYLIRTFSDDDAVILDPTAGSASTAVAAMNAERQWLAFEKSKKIFDAASARIDQHTAA